VKIGVCIKQVPPSETRILVSDPTVGVDASAFSRMITNPYDDFALEEAVRLKDAGIATEVIVFTVDNKKSEKQIRSALARGADRAIRIESSDVNGADCLGIAKVLSTVAKREEVTIIFCGKQAIDGDNAQVPPMIAELLNWSQVTVISKLEIDGDTFIAHRDVGSGSKAIVSGSLPAVFSCDKGLNTPRFPKLKENLAAKKKPLDVVTIEELGLSKDDINNSLLQETNWALPQQRGECKFIDSSDVNSAVAELIGLLKTEAKVL
jgi:electron transfer flavoprotein beta subunit